MPFGLLIDRIEYLDRVYWQLANCFGALEAPNGEWIVIADIDQMTFFELSWLCSQALNMSPKSKASPKPRSAIPSVTFEPKAHWHPIFRGSLNL